MTEEKKYDGPVFCPTKTKSEVVEEVLEKYEDPELRRFAKAASEVEGEGYCKWTRVEEVVQLSRKMGYKKLGIASCLGLRVEAKALTEILESRGFEVVCVCCKTGAVPKEAVGVEDSSKVRPGQHESMCNPIVQAEILNLAGTEFNVLLGLCVGHDSLFLKHARAMTTVLVAKDRVLIHNPAAALYSYKGYYRKLMGDGGG
jgi:uncharacterized metal-binding protein